MNMFISDVPGNNLKSLPLGNHLEHSFEFLFNILICKNFATKPWCPNNVITAIASAVA